MVESTLSKLTDSLDMFYHIQGEVRTPDMVALFPKYTHTSTKTLIYG